MKRYKLFINGQNFLVSYSGKEQKMGFYTNCFIDASGPDEAEEKSIQLLHKRKGLKKIIRNDPGDPPVLYVKEITELKSSNNVGKKVLGLVWYPEKNRESKE